MSGRRETPADMDEGLRSLLESARADYEPSAQQRAAVKRRLVQRLAQNSGDEHLASSSKSAVASVSAGKLGLFAAGLAFAAVGFWMATKTERPPNTPSRATAPPDAMVAPAPAETPSLQQSVQADQDEPRNKPAAHRSEMQKPTSSAKRSSYSSGRNRRVVVETTNDEPASSSVDSNPKAAAASVKLAVVVSSDNKAVDTTVRGASAQPSAAPLVASAQSASVAPSSPESELTLIHSIQSALSSGDAERAYALTNEHAARWPTGSFQQERDGARAIASCQLRLPAATKRARAFLTKYPQSALSPRVRSECFTGAK